MPYGNTYLASLPDLRGDEASYDRVVDNRGVAWLVGRSTRGALRSNRIEILVRYNRVLNNLLARAACLGPAETCRAAPAVQGWHEADLHASPAWSAQLPHAAWAFRRGTLIGRRGAVQVVISYSARGQPLAYRTLQVLALNVTLPARLVGSGADTLAALDTARVTATAIHTGKSGDLIVTLPPVHDDACEGLTQDTAGCGCADRLAARVCRAVCGVESPAKGTHYRTAWIQE